MNDAMAVTALRKVFMANLTAMELAEDTGLLCAACMRLVDAGDGNVDLCEECDGVIDDLAAQILQGAVN